MLWCIVFILLFPPQSVLNWNSVLLWKDYEATAALSSVKHDYRDSVLWMSQRYTIVSLNGWSSLMRQKVNLDWLWVWCFVPCSLTKYVPNMFSLLLIIIFPATLRPPRPRWSKFFCKLFFRTPTTFDPSTDNETPPREKENGASTAIDRCHTHNKRHKNRDQNLLC